MVSPQAKRAAVTELMTARGFGMARGCGLIGISRPLFRYRSRRPDSAPLRARIEETAAMKRRYGYPRVYVRLRRERWEVNRKRVYRLYREAGLAVLRRRGKRIGVVERKPLPKPTAVNASWSVDFVTDGLIGGRRLRWLTIVDDCTRECVVIEVDTCFPACASRWCSIAWRTRADCRARFPSTTTRSSMARSSTSGATVPASCAPSSDPASPTRTPTSKNLTASSATSA